METQFGVISIRDRKLIAEIDRRHFEDPTILAEWLQYLADLIVEGCFEEEEEFDEIVVRPVK